MFHNGVIERLVTSTRGCTLALIILLATSFSPCSNERHISKMLRRHSRRVHFRLKLSTTSTTLLHPLEVLAGWGHVRKKRICYMAFPVLGDQIANRNINSFHHTLKAYPSESWVLPIVVLSCFFAYAGIAAAFFFES